MLDRKFILENAEAVKLNCKNRNVTADVDRFIKLETERREGQRRLEELNQEANATAKKVGKCATPEERVATIELGKKLREQISQLASVLKNTEAEVDLLQRSIPNMAHPDAPIGDDDTANTACAYGKTPLPKFDFTPLDHVELAKGLDLIDFEGGARVAGAGFYFLKNEAVLLELALQQYAVSFLMKHGFTPASTPDLAKNEILQGTGYIPRGNETQIYSIENTDLSLVATAEITLGGLLAGRVVDAEELPMKFCGTSHCFRTEAGAAGRASRGLYRVHQFTKIEMFAFTLPEQSEAMHNELLSMEREIFDNLGLPYRVVDTATGDLGGPAYRKFDLEAWMPGRGDYGEVTSTSNCTDYQARRLNARYKNKDEKGTHFLHTLNGTAIAVSRALVAIMENYQRVDGSIVVPEVLRPCVGCDVIERKK
ncbi:MAG: serine--tRNA ligase [Thermoguttaceae bacterium]|nr:serine--tRNA ligase [Thermoguttaceae bacterium]MBQ6620106.1 serine--tRNA ligase [Thermoguttaceae bacterium]